MMNFFWPIIGGILIGLSATILLLMAGRIAGISGIVWGAIRPSSPEKGWRWLFIGGLLLGTWLFHFSTGNAYPLLENNYVTASIGGLLVGMGVNIGNGCTSGHGVCGIGRLSLRSLISTITFMVIAIVTVFVLRVIYAQGGLV